MSDGELWCVVVAAGSGTRFGAPKQFAVIGGERVVDVSVRNASQACDGVVLVLPPRLPEDWAGDPPGADVVVTGGDTRSESSLAGVLAVPESAAVILVHDAARPLASAGLFHRVARAVSEGATGAVPVVPVVDSIRSVGGAPVDRETLRSVQTPQAFDAGALRSALARGHEATDDAQAVELDGGTIAMVPGEEDNVKITRRADLGFVAAVLEERCEREGGRS